MTEPIEIAARQLCREWGAPESDWPRVADTGTAQRRALAVAFARLKITILRTTFLRHFVRPRPETIALAEVDRFPL